MATVKQICDHTLLAKDEAKEFLNEFKELVSQSQPRKKQKTNGPTAPVEGEPAAPAQEPSEPAALVQGGPDAPVEGAPHGDVPTNVNTQETQEREAIPPNQLALQTASPGVQSQRWGVYVQLCWCWVL